MKRFLALFLAALMLFSCVFVFAACDKDDDKDDKKKEAVPNSDPEVAKEALEEAGYEVHYTDVGAAGIKAAVVAVKLDEEAEKTDFISITYYEDKEAANTAWEEAQDSIDDAKASMAEMYGCKESEIVVKKSGTMIYVGTKNAVKAAK